MEYVLDIKQKGILRSPQDMVMDRRDVALARFL
jgi:hypothetical protein